MLNKIDLLHDKARLLPLIEQYKADFDFADFVPVSAAKGDGLDDLRRVMVERLPEGPAYFPEDHVTDQPERFLAAELIREKVLQLTRQEVPHSVAVMVDRWEETPGLTRIYATIRVERDGQKGIVIGTGRRHAEKDRHRWRARKWSACLASRSIWIYTCAWRPDGAKRLSSWMRSTGVQ